ncbi:MAG: VTT domain-containing protein [Terriglobia bacterium]
MTHFIRHLYVVFLHLGGFGLLAVGFLDSSFLFLPLGNDLLIIGITSSRPSRIAYYVLMATAGSVLGCFTVDLMSRREGEKALEKMLPAKRLNYVTGRVKKNAAWALTVASLMPPPFPFTPFVAASAALQYPRKRLLLVIAGSRLLRFSIEGVLAIIFGRRILALASSPVVEDGVLALVIISVFGSALSVREWIKRSK